MFSVIGYPIKLLFKFILIITISFIVTVPFNSNHSKQNNFVNFSFNYFQTDINELINQYLKRKDREKVLARIKSFGTAFYPYFFKRIDDDAARKDEYIQLYHDLELNLFDVPENRYHEIQFYQESWIKIAQRYQVLTLQKILIQWEQQNISQKKLVEELQLTGSFAVPMVLDYLIAHQKELLEGQGRFLLTFLNKNHVDFPGENQILQQNWKLSWEWWENYYLTHRNYFRKMTGFNRIIFVFTETRFFLWVKQCFTFSFGVENNLPIYEIVGKQFWRTALFALLILLTGFFFSLSLLLLNTQKRKIFLFKLVDQGMMFLNLIPFAIMIILFYTLWQQNLARDQFTGFIYGFTILGAILIPFFYVEFKLILRNNMNTPPLETQLFYQLPREVIYKKYLYRAVLLQGLNHIFKQFPFILSLILVTEYLMESGGLGELFFNALREDNLSYLKLSMLFIGLLLMIFRTFFDMINMIYYQRIKPDDYQIN